MKRLEFAALHLSLGRVKTFQDVLTYAGLGVLLFMLNFVTVMIGWSILLVARFSLFPSTTQATMDVFWSEGNLFIFAIPFALSFIPFEKLERENETLNTYTIFWFLTFPATIFYYAAIANLLHQFVPGKDERNREVDEFTRVQEEKIADQFNSIKPVSYSFSSELKGDPDLFLETYFHNTQSFKRFFLERVLNKGKVLHHKIMFLLLIPRKKTMPIATLREIILSANITEKSIFLPSSKLEALKEIVLDGGTDKFFEKLSLEQIKLIFTRPFEAEEYFDLIYDLSFCENDQLSPATTMESLIENAPMTIEKMEARLKHKYLRNLKNFIPENISCRILLSPKEFNESGIIFSNCVASYKDYDSDVFILMQDETPLACVEIKDHKINEINGYQNQRVSREIKDVVVDALKKARKFRSKT